MKVRSYNAKCYIDKFDSKPSKIFPQQLFVCKVYPIYQILLIKFFLTLIHQNFPLSKILSYAVAIASIMKKIIIKYHITS